METIKIDSTTKAHEWLTSFDTMTGLFRGQSNANWSIRASLERHFTDHLPRDDSWFFFEYEAIRSFQLKASYYHHRNLPTRTEWVTWLALIQHHGGKTRLIDFTYSPYVALYFAARDASSDFAVWRIDDLAPQFQIGSDSLREDTLHAQLGKANEFLSGLFEPCRTGQGSPKVIDGVFMLEPPFVERMSVQQGVFLSPKNLQRPFTDNLSAELERIHGPSPEVEGLHGFAKKYQFSQGLRKYLMDRLFQMNITAETLFGGLGGLATSVSEKV